MQVDRTFIRRTIAGAAAQIQQPWPPPAAEPVPLDRILEDLEVIHESIPGLNRRIAAHRLSRQGVAIEGLQQTETALAGFVFARPSSAYVFVNQSDLLVRRRFTAAHELGHFLLHFRQQAGAETDYFKADDQDQFTEEEPQGVTLDQMEREANQFAAELLMPEEVLNQRTQELRAKYQLSAAFLTNQLATELLVSREAMRWRLRNLQLSTS